MHGLVGAESRMTPFRDRLPDDVNARTALAVVVVIGCSAVFRLLDQLLLLRWPRLFVAAIRIFGAGLRASPYREGSFARKAAARGAGLSEAELRYGETPTIVARRALARAGVRPESNLLDLGAGRGRVLLAARSLGAAATGIELLDEQRLPVEAALAQVGVVLKGGDAAVAELEGFTHLWVTWTCMSEARRVRLAARFAEELVEGTVVLGVTFEPTGPRFERLWHKKAWFTWGPADLYATRIVREP